MKKSLTFLIIFSFIVCVEPPKLSSAQSDSATITKKDFVSLDKKDSSLTAKIDSQLHELKQQILNTKPERVIKFRTVIKRHVRTDSFYVLVDTCLSKTQVIAYPVHDTVFLQPPAKDNFFKRLFNNKIKKSK